MKKQIELIGLVRGCKVNGTLIEPSKDYKYSDKYNWGYSGDESKQLAYDIFKASGLEPTEASLQLFSVYGIAQIVENNAYFQVDLSKYQYAEGFMEAIKFIEIPEHTATFLRKFETKDTVVISETFPQYTKLMAKVGSLAIIAGLLECFPEEGKNVYTLTKRGKKSLKNLPKPIDSRLPEMRQVN